MRSQRLMTIDSWHYINVFYVFMYVCQLVYHFVWQKWYNLMFRRPKLSLYNIAVEICLLFIHSLCSEDKRNNLRFCDAVWHRGTAVAYWCHRKPRSTSGRKRQSNRECHLCSDKDSQVRVDPCCQRYPPSMAVVAACLGGRGWGCSRIRLLLWSCRSVSITVTA